MDSGLQRVLRGGLIALFPLVLLVVLHRTYHPTEVKDLLFVGVVALLTLGWLKLSMEQEQHQIERSWLNLVLAGNLVLWGVTLLLSSYPGEGLQTLSVRVAGVGLLLLAPFYLRRRGSISLVLVLLLSTVAVMSIYGLLQFLRLDPFLNTRGLVGHFRVSSTTDHPNIFISVLVACVPLNIVAFRYFGRSARTRVLLALGLLVDLLAAGATLSRAGWAALVGAMVVTVVGLWVLRTTRDPARSEGAGAAGKLGWILIPVVLVAIAAIALGVSRMTLDPGEHKRLLDLRGPTVEKRLLIYRAALKMAADSPVVGQGLGTFALLLPGYRAVELARYFPRNEYHVEHGVSEPLEVLAESGGLGLLAWLLLVGTLILRPFLAARRCLDGASRALLVGLHAGTLGLVLHGMVEVSLRFEPPLFLLFALPALALALERIDTPRSPRMIAIKGWPGRLAISVGAGLVFGLVFAMTLSNYVASWQVASGRRALKAGDMQGAERAFRRAEKAWSGNLPARYRRAYVLWRLGHLAQAEAEYREVIRCSPYYFDVNHNLARVLYEQGKLEQARRWISVALHVNPFHVPSHELAVRLALRRGELDPAERLARHIATVAGHDDTAQVTLARVLVARGRMDRAREILRRVLARSPGHKQARHLLRRTHP